MATKTSKRNKKHSNSSKATKTVIANTDIPTKSELSTSFFIGCFIGAVVFIILYGYKILNFTYVDWLYANQSSDIFLHQIGFEFFRNDTWRCPLGSFKNYSYPFGSSVVYTDSIPLFAIFFKLFDFILPQSFQYFGLWGILCFMLNGGISALIIRRYTSNLAAVFIGSIFIIYSPNVIWRMFGHTSLAGQWIILLAILVWCYKDYFRELKVRLLIWIFLTTLAVTIHPYFALMILIMMCGFIIDDYLENKSIKRIGAIFGCSILTAGLVFWSLGGFVVHEVSTGGLGFYSMNLNALFNPQGWSLFLKDLKMATAGQYEGFQYLGLGIIVMIPVVLFNLISQSKSLRGKYEISVIFVCCVVLVLSLSPVITFSDKILLNMYSVLPQAIIKLWSIFRASGRLFWPAYYILIFYLIIKIINMSKSKTAATIFLSLCLVIQIIDISPQLIHRMNFYRQDVVVSNTLNSDFWKDVAQEFKHIEYLSTDTSNTQYGKLALLAVKNDMTLNNGYFARKQDQKINERIFEMINNINSGQLSKDSIYVFNADDPAEMIKGEADHYLIFNVDGYKIFVAKDTLDVTKYSQYLKWIEYQWLGGFYDLEGSSEQNWRWCSDSGQLKIKNMSSQEKRLKLQMEFASGYPEKATLVLKSDIFNEVLTINNVGTEYTKELTIPPGETIIEFQCDARRVDSPADPRYLVFRVNNFIISEQF